MYLCKKKLKKTTALYSKILYLTFKPSFSNNRFGVSYKPTQIQTIIIGKLGLKNENLKSDSDLL